LYYYTGDQESGKRAAVTLRVAGARDDDVVRMLCELDCAAWPQGTVLLAEIDRRAVAALEIATGRAIADPFQRSLEAVELLRTRARQLQEPQPRAGLGRPLRLRRAAARRARTWRTAET
jgi:hypothetical protein